MTAPQFRILMVLTVVSGFLGGAAASLLLRGVPAAAEVEVLATEVQDVVRAKRFELVDNEGRMCARLAVDEGRTGLSIFDAEGRRRVGVGLATSGDAGMSVYDVAGKCRTDVGTTDGRPGIILCDAAGGERGELSLTTAGCPWLILWDEADLGAQAELGQDLGKGFRLRIQDAEGEVIWRAP